MTKEEKLELYYEAKESYYNGNPIMGDSEFDELEKELGLENESSIGSTSPNYTIKHPFIMGSLSKVQIKESKNGTIDWYDYLDEIYKYIRRNYLINPTILTPKYDGCSFEFHYKSDDKSYNIEISTRGDGNYGKDISMHVKNKFNGLNNMFEANTEFNLRGEVLVSKRKFDEKYVNDFANTRAFVAGTLNRKYDDIVDKSVLDDLDVVIYDYRVKEDGEWKDYDWMALQGLVPKDMLPEFYIVINLTDGSVLEAMYNEFAKYRESIDYALDGIVVKPLFEFRELNLTKERPSDCVAVKFLPIIQKTKVKSIEWQLGKTGEFTPVVWFDEIIFDGKKVNKASGHNYGYIKDNGIDEDAEILISMAGDIIPFIYGVEKPVELNWECADDEYIDGCHLMKKLNLVDKMNIDFLASCKSLNINGLGDQISQKIFDSLEYKVEHIFFVEDYHIRKALESGEGKTASNICKAIDEKKKSVTLDEVIASMNITDCGPKCALQCAKQLTLGSGDFSGLSSAGWNWVLDVSLPFDRVEASERIFKKLISILNHMNPIDANDDWDYIHMFNKHYEKMDDSSKVKVILTGSPSKYKTKKEFLEANPEFEETSKWKDCQILFTGDIHSTSSKMEKAKKLGIEIREY